MEVTESFVEYIKTKPIVFEVFGHYQQHPLHLQGQELNRFGPNEQRFFVGIISGVVVSWQKGRTLLRD